MTLNDLQSWILSDDGLAGDLDMLARLVAANSIGNLDITDTPLHEFQPEWRRILFAGSILSASFGAEANESALTVAQAGLLYGQDHRIADASATILSQLANYRAVNLAIDREYLTRDYAQRLGTTEQMLLTRRELQNSIYPVSAPAITANRFQRDFWSELQNASWVSASAPTASGKTYLVLQWVLNEFAAQRARMAVVIAPTRALVGEIERQLLELSVEHEIEGLRVASLPLAALADRSRPTVLVFTQERLHVFLNSVSELPKTDITVVDESHKIGDGLRGVILQDAIERIARVSPSGRLVFMSPLTENPEKLVEDAPQNLRTAVLPNNTATVTQNLVVAEQVRRRPDRWTLLLRKGGEDLSLGTLQLHAKPDTQLKRLSYVALAVGRGTSGTLVYANEASQAEQVAWQIFQGLGPGADNADQELIDLADFARDTIHPKFQLVQLVRRGVAFHYGNMPTLLRSEIERLFTEGTIQFLVCTSTLVEGVNLACRTIVARGPKKGRRQPMGPHDFWNLAGRAGRWGQDFSGNIICVDSHWSNLWPHGIPERARYPIHRETDSVLTEREAMLQYLEAREQKRPSQLTPSLEQVAAYLLAWQAREGTLLNSPTAGRLPRDYAEALDSQLDRLLKQVDLPSELISRHPGVSASALQSLLEYFRSRRKPVEDLLPSPPESEESWSQLIAIFRRINSNLVQAFYPDGAVPVFALVTNEWMRGFSLGYIIRRRIKYYQDHNRTYKTATVIRNTMRDVEEVARFRAPKYLAAYLDVLQYFLHEIGRSELIPEDRFDLFLEFGVATETLLSLIGIGLSRTSAVYVNEYLGDDTMDEGRVYEWLKTRQWESMELPAVVRRELENMLNRRAQFESGANIRSS